MQIKKPSSSDAQLFKKFILNGLKLVHGNLAPETHDECGNTPCMFTHSPVREHKVVLYLRLVMHISRVLHRAPLCSSKTRAHPAILKVMPFASSCHQQHNTSLFRRTWSHCVPPNPLTVLTVLQTPSLYS